MGLAGAERSTAACRGLCKHHFVQKLGTVQQSPPAGLSCPPAAELRVQSSAATLSGRLPWLQDALRSNTVLKDKSQQMPGAAAGGISGPEAWEEDGGTWLGVGKS